MRQRFDLGAVAGILLLAATILGIAGTAYLNTRTLREESARATKSRELIDAVAAVAPARENSRPNIVPT